MRLTKRKAARRAVSAARLARYRAEYAAALGPAIVEGYRFQRALTTIADLDRVRERARAAKLAAARVETAAACLLDPP